MQCDTAIDIAAGAGDVWSVLMDVESWPEWTASMSSVKRLDVGPFRMGSHVRILQPKLPRAVWTVTEVDPVRSFTWVASGPGFTTTAEHRVEPASERSVRVSLSLRQSCALAPILGLFLSGITRRYVTLEAEGLKRRCEARSG